MIAKKSLWVLVLALIGLAAFSAEADARWFRRCRPLCCNPSPEYKKEVILTNDIAILHPIDTDVLGGGGKFFVWGTKIPAVTITTATVQWTGGGTPKTGSSIFVGAGDDWAFRFNFTPSANPATVYTLTVSGTKPAVPPTNPPTSVPVTDTSTFTIR